LRRVPWLAVALLVAARAAADPPQQPASFGPAPSTGPITEDERAFGDAYRGWLDEARTTGRVRGFLSRTASGFRVVDASDDLGRLSPGTKLLFSNRDRSYLLVVVGRRPMSEGFRMIGTHIDTPSFRVLGSALDDGETGAVLHANAYGGIKPYQWVGMPLALVGEIHAHGGRRIDVDLGPREGFAFVISDLDPLGGPADGGGGGRQSRADADVVVATVPAFGSEGGPRITFLRAMRRAYGTTARDLEAAELYLVPAQGARDVGVDRAIVGSHGQDDRACSYAAIRAVVDLPAVPERTAIVYLTDREEIGASGTAGAASGFLRRALGTLLGATSDVSSDFDLGEALARSRVLSSDVTAGVDPNFRRVHEPMNAAFVGRGPAIMKYTGHGGKYGASDASPEFIAELRALWTSAGIPIQATEIGRVDEGGGGTIAHVIAELGPEVLDLGVPLVSMHSPFELVHRRDLFALYRADTAFLTAP
jgi:aspartyl aminopeptidase